MARSKSKVEENNEVIGITDMIRSQFVQNLEKNGEKSIIDTIEKVVDEYFATKDLRQKTELDKSEIAFFTKLKLYQILLQRLLGHDSDYINAVKEEYMSLKVSHERKGRREITNIFTALLEREKEKEEEEDLGFLKKLFSKKVD